MLINYLCINNPTQKLDVHKYIKLQQLKKHTLPELMQ